MAVYPVTGGWFDGKGAHGAHSGRRMEGKRKREMRREKERNGNGENEGNDQRERERKREKEGMRKGRIGRGFGMPRYRETEENESSAIGAYYGSHVLFW